MNLRNVLVTLVLVCTVQGANAALITYDYSFDTPTFDDPPFGPLNALLLSLGPTISGAISFDTADATPSGMVDVYSTFTHTGNLDSAGFDNGPTNFRALTGTTTPLAFGSWSLSHAVGAGSLYFFIDFEMRAAWAGCTSFGTAVDCGEGVTNLTAIRRTDVNLTMRPPGVPVPATLSLFGLGLAGLGVVRRKRAAQS